MEFHLKVATLNFSGINVSPFEYHDGSQQKNILDRTFKALLDKCLLQHPEGPQNIAKIDKIFQKERYTILYQPDCGCIRGKLLTKEQFEIVWDRTYEQNQSMLKDMQLSDAALNKLRNFDYMIYHAYLEVLFGDVDMGRLEQYSSKTYLAELKKWHSKSYLNQNSKITFVKEYILKQELDVLFLQEAIAERAGEYLPSENYSFASNADSLVIYKNQSYFVQDYQDQQDFNLKYANLLNFNKDSCFFKAKNTLLVSAHLSSKKVNVEQAKEMFETLDRIERENKSLKIIVGVDANHKINNSRNFKVFPEANTPTTRKKRTSLQCQFQKANKLVEESKDFIVTNIPISSSRVETIRSWKTNVELLPNQDHPFDHFMVSANLQFDKPAQRIQASAYLKYFGNSLKLLIDDTSKQNSNRSMGDPGQFLGRMFGFNDKEKNVRKEGAVHPEFSVISNIIPRRVQKVVSNYSQERYVKWSVGSVNVSRDSYR